MFLLRYSLRQKQNILKVLYNLSQNRQRSHLWSHSGDVKDKIKIWRTVSVHNITNDVAMLTVLLQWILTERCLYS